MSFGGAQTDMTRNIGRATRPRGAALNILPFMRSLLAAEIEGLRHQPLIAILVAGVYLRMNAMFRPRTCLPI